MTSKDLTEKWKKGELEDGCYYVKIKRPDMFYMLSREDDHWYEFGWDCWFFDDDIAEILAPIPSYEQWEQLQNWADFTSDYHELREKLEIAEYKNAELENKMNLERQLYKYVLEENAKLKEDYNRLGKLLQKMEDSDNAREKFQNGQIEKLKELLKECRDEIAYVDYDSPVNEREQNELLAKIDEVLK